MLVLVIAVPTTPETLIFVVVIAVPTTLEILLLVFVLAVPTTPGKPSIISLVIVLHSTPEKLVFFVVIATSPPTPENLAQVVVIAASDGTVGYGSNGFDGEGCELRLWDKRKLQQIFEMKGHSQVTATSEACLTNPVSVEEW